MIITTTPSVEGKSITEHLGIVGSEAVLAGGDSEALKGMRKDALREMQSQAEDLGANAVVGVDINYQLSISDSRIFVLFSASGTAVKLNPPR